MLATQSPQRNHTAGPLLTVTMDSFFAATDRCGLVLVGWVPAFEFINTQIMHRLRRELAFEPAS
ncbi:MAG: hypothetical protein DMG24_15855 [Acidobacteria bacterium]|nr:MAG: hypothetical protein DMG24_15855 [Acidobacteriota bacterium]